MGGVWDLNKGETRVDRLGLSLSAQSFTFTLSPAPDGTVSRPSTIPRRPLDLSQRPERPQAADMGEASHETKVDIVDGPSSSSIAPGARDPTFHAPAGSLTAKVGETLPTHEYPQTPKARDAESAWRKVPAVVPIATWIALSSAVIVMNKYILVRHAMFSHGDRD